MKYFLLLISFFMYINLSARTMLDASYGVYNGDSFNIFSVNTRHMSMPHMFFTSYSLIDNMDNEHTKLNKFSAGYMYLDDIQAGIIASSNTDKLFTSEKTFNFFAFGAYKVYYDQLSASQNGRPPREHSLSLGAVLSTVSFLGSNVMPYISYKYEGEIVSVSLGVPKNQVKITPHEQHSITFQIEVKNGLSAAYEFKPIPLLKLSTGYENFIDSFIIEEDADYILNRQKQLHYNRSRLFISAEQYISRMAKIDFKYAHQLTAYKDYGYTYKQSRSIKLPYTGMYQIGILVMF